MLRTMLSIFWLTQRNIFKVQTGLYLGEIFHNFYFIHYEYMCVCVCEYMNMN